MTVISVLFAYVCVCVSVCLSVCLTRVGGVLGLEQQTTIRSFWTVNSFQLPYCLETSEKPAEEKRQHRETTTGVQRETDMTEESVRALLTVTFSSCNTALTCPLTTILIQKNMIKCGDLFN